MQSRKSRSKSNTTLQDKAERHLSEKPQKERPRDPGALLHELEVHQIELEMQNEELQRSLREAEEAKNKYADFYDFAPVGYLTFDEKGIISELNLAAANLLGVERQYLIHAPFHGFSKSEFQDTFHLHRREVLNSCTKHTCELALKKSDGTFFDARLDSLRVETHGQTLIRTVLTDITEHKRMEEGFIRVQKLEALGTLAGGIAHDFNNILAGIMGFTELALEDINPDGPEHKKLEVVLRGVNRGRDLVRQILTFSTNAKPDRKPLALHRTVEEGLKLLRPALPSTIRIISKGLINDDRILADPVQMQQVLMNLCTNAAHAMRDKGGVLEISVSNTVVAEEGHSPVQGMVPGEYIGLSVQDTGCGMESETLHRIFDPFFTTKPPGEGTGLGLSVVHGITKSHGGYVSVESETGKGSAFHVYLPKITEQVRPEEEESLSMPGGKERILFIDDENLLIELNGERLGRLGYEVVATTSSTEALKIFRKDPDKFDLVITDYTMPDLTGTDLAAELLNVKPTIPIILCTGHGSGVSPEHTEEAGIKAFLMKPVGKRQMAQAIRRVLDAKT